MGQDRNSSFITGAPAHLYAGGTIKRRRGVTMTPAEILSTHRFGDISGTKAEQDAKGATSGGTNWMMDSTLEGSTRDSLVDSIKSRGFDSSKPIVLNPSHPLGPTIVDGHHRLVAAHAVDPHTPIPVMFTNDQNYNSTLNKSPEEFSKRKLMEPKLNKNVYAGNCKACGQTVAEGEGALIKVQGKGNPYHLYHPEHLTPKQQALYTKYPSKKRP